MKKIYFGIIKFFQTVVSLLLVLVYNNKGAGRKVRRLMKDRQGRAATLLANGPSAREIVTERKDLLEGTDLMVLNDFGNTDKFFELKPTYYILLDPAYFDYNFKNPGLNENNADENRTREKVLMENFKKVDWDMTLFYPSIYKAKKVKSLFDFNPNIEVIPYNATRVMGYDGFQNFMYKRAQGLPSSRNVIIPAMMLFPLLGYKTVYLYGCEISWTKTMDVDLENGRMFFNDRHFYSKDEIRYFGKGAYLWWLEAISEMLRGVEQIAKFANYSGVRIINRTKGSFIDAFEYENPDTVQVKKKSQDGFR